MKNFSPVVDFILPPRCIVTGDIVDQQGMLSPAAWAKLDFITPPQCYYCGIPFDFDRQEDEKHRAACGACLQERPAYDRARAALVYNDESRQLILPFKHGDKMHFVSGFLPWLKQAGRELIEEADIMLPIPLHRWRLLKRRYNQAGILARSLAMASHKPFLLDGLERIRATPTQGRLRVKERQNNVKRAFRVRERHIDKIKQKNILLIDDVFTTGATVSECAKTLKKAGASRVDVLTLARVVRSASRV